MAEQALELKVYLHAPQEGWRLVTLDLGGPDTSYLTQADHHPWDGVFRKFRLGSSPCSHYQPKHLPTHRPNSDLAPCLPPGPDWP